VEVVALTCHADRDVTDTGPGSNAERARSHEGADSQRTLAHQLFEYLEFFYNGRCIRRPEDLRLPDNVSTKWQPSPGPG